ncbi:Heterokaryon incompatibility protein [Colletotrichum scovillei]|uniref:Heterokaryon incompatibility protein n=1 Tax=Colletotrichum scovillei TaxID=1209932 RepID=A0A9P7U793_9PEZI|nr:Heterokaryon incompatibility protein [Colletotrichum scovillei]KAG7042340.1 Heterokaryon incompatibility protein [Colletotrichum scovillei]KAG7062374.1 Heterokaryon incompatibility protein [Colletotrichum scovillei]
MITAVTDDRVLPFEELIIVGPSPSSAQLLEYVIHPRIPDNSYGEIVFAKRILKAFTMPSIRSRQIVSTYHNTASIGHATFDDPAAAVDKNKIAPSSLLRVNGGDRDYVASIATGPGDKSN